MSVEGMNYDNMFIRMLNRLGDAMILSLMFVIGSIPIVTIGTSMTATYYAAMKGVQGDDGYVFKNYIKSYKQNFKQSVVIWLIMAVVLFVFGVDLWFWLKQWQDARVGIAKPMIAVSVVLLAVAVFITMYVFPLQAKFDNKTSVQIRNAFLLSIKNFPTTLLLVVITAIIAWCFYYQVVLAVVGFVLIGFGFCAYLYAYFMLNCLKPYLEPAPQVDPDQWSVDLDEESESEDEDEAEGDEDEEAESKEDATEDADEGTESEEDATEGSEDEETESETVEKTE
ncbi:MAG: YesL family protein [Lachnospiraceae bacterium]|nr:YesL family protein [Lachnospiraceae bacterium]